jgi:EAL and modified HD-GYP domain-containing signal transduction protein
MSASVLGSVTLGYEPIWNRLRRCCGMRVFVDANRASAVDAHHLLAAMTELWPDSAPRLMLQVRSQALLADLLDHAPANGIQIEIGSPWLEDAMLAGRVRKAHQRGVRLVWSGDPGESPAPEVAPWFDNTLRMLTAQEALGALRVSLRQHQDGGMGTATAGTSPVVPACYYQGLASQALVEHALDRQGITGAAGWPAEEILHGYRFQQIQPDRQLLGSLLKAIDADESMETLEHRLGNEPLLAYRFLRYANSAHLGSKTEVDTIRQGLMVMGYTKFKNWLLEQLPHASSDVNLAPIRASMVWRARIMEHLCDAGAEDSLRREVFLCGIFSQLDLLLGEPLGTALHRLPLPGRIASAIIGQSGPYAPWLEVASALESHNTSMIHDVCEAHGMPADAVNRALLRTLAAL